MKENTPPAKKSRSNTPRSTPAPPVRVTRLQKSREAVANECEQNVRSLRERKKKLRLRLQFEKEVESLDAEVNAAFVFQYAICTHICIFNSAYI